MPKKMRKTSSSSTMKKKPSQGEAKPVVIQQAKRVLKPGKFGKEIEDIFAARIKLRQMVQIPETNESKAEIAKKKRKRDRLERKNNPGSEPRRRQTRERTELDNNPGSEVRSQTTELDNNKPESESMRQTTELDNNNAGSEPKRRRRRERTELDDNNPERKIKKKKRSGPRKITTEGLKVFREDEIGGPRKRTTDGLKVFREDEIGFNKAKSGGTRLCPFDCNCCF